jgi:hypothetical protein
MVSYCQFSLFTFVKNQKVKTMSSSVNIRDFKLYKAVAPLKKPIADATHTLHEISFLVLRLQLENGVVANLICSHFNILRMLFKGLLEIYCHL